MGLFLCLRQAIKKYFLYRKLSKRFPSLIFEEGLIIKGSIQNLKLGNNVILQSNVLLHLGGMDWCAKKGSLIIGNNAVISPNTIIYAAGPGGITIGDNFDCAPGVKIFSSSTDYQNNPSKIFKPVTIGNNVILYSNVVISPGVTIGDNSVVLANSVVVNEIPSNSVYAGLPAKFLKKTI